MTRSFGPPVASAAPSPPRRPRRALPPLYLSEAEVAAHVGLSLEDWKAAASALEKQGLPRPDPIFGNRRYLPAVRAFLDRRYGLRQQSLPSDPDGEDRRYDHHAEG